MVPVVGFCCGLNTDHCEEHCGYCKHHVKSRRAVFRVHPEGGDNSSSCSWPQEQITTWPCGAEFLHREIPPLLSVPPDTKGGVAATLPPCMAILHDNVV